MVALTKSYNLISSMREKKIFFSVILTGLWGLVMMSLFWGGARVPILAQTGLFGRFALGEAAFWLVIVSYEKHAAKVRSSRRDGYSTWQMLS